MSMFKRLLTVSLLVTGFQSWAQQDSAFKKQLDEVVVTATKYPKKTSETGKVITIITREQLAQSAGKDLAQLLNEQTGISVNGSYSNPGKDKSIFLRGAKSEYTLITIDGVPVYDATGSNSNFDFRLMPIDFIERIEILKGSQSTLYGSDAIAGVINIITKKGGNKPVSPFATVTYGTYKTLKLNAGVNGHKGPVSYNIGFAHYKTDGISESTDKNNAGGFDEDGYEQNSVNANLGFAVSKNIKLNPFIRYSRYSGKLDADAFADDKDYSYGIKNLQTGIRNEFVVGRAKINVLYSFTGTRRNYFNDSLIKESALDGYSTGYYEGKEHFVDAYINFPIVNGLSFIGGGDYRNSHTDVQTSGMYKYTFGGPIFTDSYATNISADSAKQEQIGVYGAFTYAGKTGFNAEIGGRYNHHSVYGNNFVFNVNPSYLINRQFKVFANLSSAYKVPTLYQLYSEYRNPFTDLKPEKAITYEGGIQYTTISNLVNVRATVFKRDVEDGIAFYTDPNTFNSFYINQDKQKDWGFELEPTITLKNKGQVILSYAFVDGKITTKNSGKDTSYFNLVRRPKNVIGVTVNYYITKKLFASASFRNFGKRTDIDFSSFPSKIVELPAYSLFNFYTEYNVSKQLKLFVDIKNIANTSYSEVLGYNTQGRTLHAGVTVHL
jgi:vitamin B12 transporter